MKQKNNYRYLLMGLVMAFTSSAVMLSCKDDDPTLAELRDDKIAYLADSIRVADSLSRLNAAGVVNYAITVVDGSTSSFFKLDGSRTEASKSVLDGVLVTISQFGKIVTDTTDARGMVVLNGFFRGAVNVTVQKEGFTTAAFVTATKVEDETENGTVSFVGNLIPIFQTSGDNTATVSGVAKIQSDLTNTTRENVPDGTTILAHIDARDSDFGERFLSSPAGVLIGIEAGLVLDGIVLEASYSTGVVGAVTAGAYTVTVPAAIDGLPITFEYSDVALDRLRFESNDGEPNQTNRTIKERTIYGPGAQATYVDPAGGVTLSFSAGSGAEANALVSEVGTVESVTVTAGGSHYSGTPRVELQNGGGTGATATAVVTNGVVTAVNVVNKGTGYTSEPDVVFFSGTGALASASLDVNNGTVLSITVNNAGAGYTSAPTVSFVGGGTPTTPATATAIITAGRVTAINVTNPGVGYSGAPTVNLTGGGFTVAATATANFSGVPVQSVNLTAAGANYTYAPSVVFSAPQVPSGVRATGTATVDVATGVVTGVQVTNPGSGYTAPPSVTLDAGSGAAAESFLTGGAITSIDVVDQGGGYVAPPTVKITGSSGGSGAVATATVVAGRVTAINVTNGGSGYFNGDVTVELISGEGARGVATIVNGVITGIRVTSGGSGYTGAPVVTITGDSGQGNGATATATVAGGQVTGFTVTAGGTGYVSGNTPGDTSEDFTAKVFPYDNIWVKPGVKYINDIYYGTGEATQP
ncbi:MAG TPA: hypothetical protein VFE50_26270 [Cyclobacteriaceae bacterium]|nr:hypothetical protein [Cyclobacteriaceae bacterium]